MFLGEIDNIQGGPKCKPLPNDQKIVLNHIKACQIKVCVSMFLGEIDNIQGGPKCKPLPNDQKNRIKSY